VETALGDLGKAREDFNDAKRDALMKRHGCSAYDCHE